MGNLSSTGATPLAIMAVARQLSLQQSQILTMWENLRAFSDKDGFVSRQFFDLSLTRAKIIQPVALQIFDLLFTLWDHHAIGEIPVQKFSVGIAPLTCSVADIPSVLRLAFHIYDNRGQGKVSPKALHDVLICIDNTASYFGDVHLMPGDIDNIVENVFDLGNGRTMTSLPLNLVIRRLQSNAYIKRFISGKPRQQVHFKVDVEVLTETEPQVPLGISKESSLPTPPIPTRVQAVKMLSADKENHPTLLHQQTKDINKHDLQTPVAPTRSSSGLDESWTSFFSQDNHKSRDPPSTILVYPGDHHVDSPLSLVRGLDPPSFQC